MGLWSWLRGARSGRRRAQPRRAAPPHPRRRRRPTPGGARCRPSSGRSATARSPSRGSVPSPGASRPGRAPGCSPGWSTDADRRRPQGRSRGSSTRSAGAPGLTSLPASPVPVPPCRCWAVRRGARAGDVVQRSVRFDRPGGAVQRALSDLRGTSTAVQRAVEPSTGSGGPRRRPGRPGGPGSAPVGASPADRAAGRGRRPRRAARRDRAVGAGSRRHRNHPASEPSGSEPSGVATVRVRTIRRETVRRARRFRTIRHQIVRSRDARRIPARPDAPRSPPSAPSPSRRPGDGRPDPGATPLQRTLADPPAPVGPAATALPQLPVVPEPVVARSFVHGATTADGAAGATGRRRSSAGESCSGPPPPRQARRPLPRAPRRRRPPLPLDVGRTAPGLVGGAPTQRARRPVAGAASASAGCGCVRARRPPLRLRRTLPDVRRSWPTHPRPRSSPRRPTEPIDGPSTPTVSRLAAGPTPAPRRLGLGAPLTRPPHRPSGPPGETGPVVQMLHRARRTR